MDNINLQNPFLILFVRMFFRGIAGKETVLTPASPIVAIV